MINADQRSSAHYLRNLRAINIICVLSFDVSQEISAQDPLVEHLDPGYTAKGYNLVSQTCEEA